MYLPPFHVDSTMRILYLLFYYNIKVLELKFNLFDVEVVKPRRAYGRAYGIGFQYQIDIQTNTKEVI